MLCGLQTPLEIEVKEHWREKVHAAGIGMVVRLFNQHIASAHSPLPKATKNSAACNNNLPFDVAFPVSVCRPYR
jgi:hypothetical protein